MKFYFFPNPYNTILHQTNPYSKNFIESLVDNGIKTTNQESSISNIFVEMLVNSRGSNIYILNWIEELGRGRGRVVYGFLLILFFIINKIQRKKIVWVFHNIESHYKETIFTRVIKRVLFKWSDLIITLSKRGYDILSSSNTSAKLLFHHHPINSDLLSLEIKQPQNQYDILIWGSVIRYKGIVEFLEFLHSTKNENKYNILIIGKCSDLDYKVEVENLCNSNIEFYDQFTSFEEVKGYISNSKYILFPYIGNSVSSSGALIDTITMNGNCIGPKIGAFKDLADEYLCLTYDKYEDIVDIIESKTRIKQADIDRFVRDNTWNQFANSLKKELEKL